MALEDPLNNEASNRSAEYKGYEPGIGAGESSIMFAWASHNMKRMSLKIMCTHFLSSALDFDCLRLLKKYKYLLDQV